ncbi:MAG: AAA family ATPase [Patescibacteria group bacterium]|nr:AAA family ATPase [Patescibacteria group bacterium]
MKLNHLFLKSYGPLSDHDYLFKPGFNLVFGKNEKGKSLSLDALVKLLVGKASKKFEEIDRVEALPQQFGGFLELEYQSNNQTKQIKLQGEGNLASLINISPQDCQNIFIIRNSDLSIGRDISQEQNYYTNLTDKLTGLKTEQIKQLKDIILDQASLTDKTHKFSNTENKQKLANRIKKALELISPIGSIQELLDKNQEEHWSKLIENRARLKLNLKKTEKKIAQLNVARKREEYATLKKNLEQLIKVRNKLKKLKKINLRDLRAWEKHENNLENWFERKKEYQTEFKQLQKERKQAQKKQKKLVQEQEKLAKRYQEIDSAHLPELEKIKNKKSNLAEIKTMKKNWLLSGGVSLIITLFALTASLSNSNLIVNLILMLGTVGTLFSLLKLYTLNKSQAQFESSWKQFKLNLSKFEISGKSIKQVSAQIQKIIEQYDQNKSALTDETADLKRLINQQDKVKNKLEQVKSNLDKIKSNIEELQQQSGVKKVKKYSQQLVEKQGLETILKGNQKNLGERLGEKHLGLMGQIEVWSKKIKQLAHYQDQAIAFKFSEKKLDETQQDRQKIIQNLDKLTLSTENIKEQLKLIKQGAQKILLSHQDFALESLADLLYLKQLIEQFIGQHQTNKKRALQVIELLSAIEAEEKEKISSLFGVNSLISQFFSQITDNAYKEVRFNQETQAVEVISNSKETLQPGKLSAGTYDQLYFAIRLGLAKKLLKDEPGFLIMDDPFIKSDQGRLNKQLKTLLELAQQNWQIIYFSAKDEVKDQLSQLNKNHHLIELA